MRLVERLNRLLVNLLSRFVANDDVLVIIHYKPASKNIWVDILNVDHVGAERICQDAIKECKKADKRYRERLITRAPKPKDASKFSSN